MRSREARTMMGQKAESSDENTLFRATSQMNTLKGAAATFPTNSFFLTLRLMKAPMLDVSHTHTHKIFVLAGGCKQKVTRHFL